MAEVSLDDEANAVREAVREFMMRQSRKKRPKTSDQNDTNELCPASRVRAVMAPRGMSDVRSRCAAFGGKADIARTGGNVPYERCAHYLMCLKISTCLRGLNQTLTKHCGSSTCNRFWNQTEDNPTALLPAKRKSLRWIGKTISGPE